MTVGRTESICFLTTSRHARLPAAHFFSALGSQFEPIRLVGKLHHQLHLSPYYDLLPERPIARPFACAGCQAV